MASIPASQLVNVTPGVVGTGGSPLSLNGVFLTTSTAVPIGSVLSWPDIDSVTSFFGAGSTEATNAAIYFNGFDNSTIKPGALWFAQYPTAAVAAYLRSGSLASMSLTALKALPAGTLIVTMNGTQKTSSSINLSAATSFSNAATLIAAAFTSGPTCTWDAQRSAFVLTSSTTGAASTMTVATGTLAASLNFTAATGAVLSQGADIAVPGTFMTALKALTQNWATFMTLFEPQLSDKLLFAQWANSQNKRFLYVAWDSDTANATAQGNTTAIGPVCKAAAYNGVMCVYPSVDKAAFVCGMAASIDFSRTNGRITFAYKSQAGLTADVTDTTIATNLIANGYSFYGSYATANDSFAFLQDGNIPGVYKWADSFINQVRLNSQFQLVLLTLLTGTKSLPYNADGYAAVSLAMRDPINEALNFGSIRKGVTLSNQQKAIINQQAGVDIDQMLYQQGWYLQVLDPGAQVRGQRGTPVINFWYMDGQAIQKINISSIDVL